MHRYFHKKYINSHASIFALLTNRQKRAKQDESEKQEPNETILLGQISAAGARRMPAESVSTAA